MMSQNLSDGLSDELHEMLQLQSATKKLSLAVVSRIGNPGAASQRPPAGRNQSGPDR